MTGKHRHPGTLRPAGLISLAVALVTAGVMLTFKPAGPAPPADSVPAEVALSSVYPDVNPTTLASDGYYPLFFINENLSMGTVEASDGSVRLLLRRGADARELRRLPKAQSPEFAGFVAEGEKVAWFQLTLGEERQAVAELWILDSLEADPRLVTADTGDVALFDRRDDLVLHDGEASWVAQGPTELPTTEVRTVPLSGGQVRIDTREGAFSFAGWPWLATVNLGQSGPIELRNLLTNEQSSIPVHPNELMACSSAWCRSVIIGSGEANTVIELQRTDGTGRFRSASGSVAASIVDVAVLDRFEIYSHSGGKLVLFDIEAKRSLVVAQRVGQVVCRGSVLWWSTGDNEAQQWHALDLNRLIKP